MNAGEKRILGCTQWFKDTKLKVNHNQNVLFLSVDGAVLNGSKILN